MHRTVLEDLSAMSQNPSKVLQLNTGPNWDALGALYAEGAADIEIAKELGITMAQFTEMETDYPEFADFVAKGRTLSHAWWVKKAREALFNKELNTTLFTFNMKNRFGWADKIDTKDTSEEHIGDADSLRSAVIRAAKKLNKKHPELLKEMTETGDTDGSA